MSSEVQLLMIVSMFRTSFIQLVTIIILLETIHCFVYMMVPMVPTVPPVPILCHEDVNVNKEEEEERLENTDGGVEKYLRFDELPVGYRFLPTDIDLIYYLESKVSFELIPNPIQDIEATVFYSRPPYKLEWNPPVETKDMFFFIHHTEDSYNHPPSTRIVADGIGCWKPNGVEQKIYRLPRHCEIGNNGADIGDKSIYTYFRGKPPVGMELPKLKKTAWVMHEYRLPQDYNYNSPKIEGKWVLGRIKCGKNVYKNS